MWRAQKKNDSPATEGPFLCINTFVTFFLCYDFEVALDMLNFLFQKKKLLAELVAYIISIFKL